MIIVFGGAFNPVTNAHIKVYQHLNEIYPEATFMYLPVSNLYTKSYLVGDYHRLNMLRLATKQFNNVVVSEIEMEDSDFLGTYQSLIRISDKYQEEVYFVVGADNVLTMEKWINIDGILSEFKIIVLGRSDIDVKSFVLENKVLKRHPKSFIIFEDFKVDVSSTEFRETFDQTMVPKPVYDYIIENELYRGEDDVS